MFSYHSTLFTASLLSLHPTNIPSPLFSSNPSHFSSFHFSESSPLYHLSSTISDWLWMLTAQPQRLFCLYAVMRGFEETVVMLHVLSPLCHFIFSSPASRLLMSELSRWSAAKTLLILCFAVTGSEALIDCKMHESLHMCSKQAFQRHEVSLTLTFRLWKVAVFCFCVCVCMFSLCMFESHLVFYWPPGRGTAEWWGLSEWWWVYYKKGPVPPSWTG